MASNRPGRRVGWRTPLRAAVLIFVPLLAPGPAGAASCAPPSAEHAFEELLEALADDSAAEEEAWRIAEEQEAAGRFETLETMRRIDALAARELLVYDCAVEGFRSASGGPTPGELEQEGDPGESEDGAPDGAAAGPGEPGASGGSGPGDPASAAPDGSVPEGSPVDGMTDLLPATGSGSGGTGSPAGDEARSGEAHSGNGTDGTAGPAATDRSEGGAVAPLPGGGSGRSPRLLGLLLAAAGVAGAAGLAARRP